MDVDALRRGKSKGKGKKGKGSSGKGKGSKGQNSTSNVVGCETVVSQATTRKTVDKSGDRTRVCQEQVRKVTNMLMDGLGVVSKLKDGGRQQMIGHLRKQKNQLVKILTSAAPKDATARAPEGAQNKE